MTTSQQTELLIRVELFGLPRLRSGQRMVELLLPAEVSLRDVAPALGQACPALVAHTIREDLSGPAEGYLFNLNGTRFLTGEQVNLRPGDALLLLSNQAGG
ncbi:MAG: MoaD/ThiS family protein [SAR202 cluster bacterium]|nr:MoaD/ThiS family protein [SAR202 cluster bacterium]